MRGEVHEHTRDVPDDDDGEERAERLGTVVPVRVLLPSGPATVRSTLFTLDLKQSAESPGKKGTCVF